MGDSILQPIFSFVVISKFCQKLITIPSTLFVHDVSQQGKSHLQEITLTELFGGLAIWLEVVLQCNIKDHKYINYRMDASAQQLIPKWLDKLTQQYPELFPSKAWYTTFNFFPLDT